jgi:hypothetical protein
VSPVYSGSLLESDERYWTYSEWNNLIATQYLTHADDVVIL